MFRGSGVAIVTPFNKDFSVDYDGLRRLVEFHIENKTDAIIIAGTTGEASTLSTEEHIEVIARCVEYVGGRVPVIAGTGSNSTHEAINLSTEAERVGADGLLVVTPYYNKSNRKGLVNHFKKVAESVNIPLILYNVPSRTGVNMPADVILELSEVKNIIGIKEASGDISYASEIARVCPAEFNIYSGNDDIILPMMALGGKGVISVVANVKPQEVHNLTEAVFSGDIDEARRIQLGLNGFINSLFIEVNPIPVKTAMNLCGLDAGPLRMPLEEMEEGNKAILIEEMKKVGISVG